MATPRGGGGTRKKSARRPGAEGAPPENPADASAARAEKAASAAGAEGEKRPARKPVRQGPAATAQAGGFQGRLEEFGKYLKSVRAEMKRVTWPGWPEVRAATVVVVLTLLIISGYMGIVDWILTQIFGTPTTGSY